MPTLTRRRFLTLTAAVALPLRAHAAGITEWHGTALGAEAAIWLDHPDADAVIAGALAEIARLEDIFSLYRPASALSVLNATGRLDAPPFELLECLALCSRVHAATAGVFDPTVQPLWQLYAARFAAGSGPRTDEIAQVLRRVGMSRVVYDGAAVVLERGMALTLNGVAQGFIADKVAAVLERQGLTDILINTGELRALGGRPGGGGWSVGLAGGGAVSLRARALATSAPLGTVFDAAGRVGHILHPVSGLPAALVWQTVSISAPSAALADALSTAACLMPDRATVQAMVAAFEGARIEALI
jgi:FAD:protein FMN transferase